jgi:hypothetical protein
MQRPFNLTEKGGGIFVFLEAKIGGQKKRRFDMNDTTKSASFVIFKGNF